MSEWVSNPEEHEYSFNWDEQGEFDYAVVYKDDGIWFAEVGQGGMWGGEPFFKKSFPEAELDEVKAAVEKAVPEFVKSGKTTERAFQPEYYGGI